MEKILFFDGVCNMCNGLINFGLRYDSKQEFKYAALQGQTAKEHIPQYHDSDLTTVVLLENTKIYTESDAILRFLVGLGGFYKIAGIFKIIPKSIRDSAYKFIARNRYRWFGKSNQCRLPTPSERERLLD